MATNEKKIYMYRPSVDDYVPDITNSGLILQIKCKQSKYL